MIHLTTIDRDAAIDFANQLTRRKGGPEVSVYTSLKRHEHLVLDEAAFIAELPESGGLTLVYSPERRRSPRVPFRAFVSGAVFKKRIANA